MQLQLKQHIMNESRGVLVRYVKKYIYFPLVHRIPMNLGRKNVKSDIITEQDPPKRSEIES